LNCAAEQFRVEPSRISARRARGVWNERSERRRTSGWGPDYPANFPLGNVLTTWTGSWTAVFVINIVAAVMALAVLRPMRRQAAT